MTWRWRCRWFGRRNGGIAERARRAESAKVAEDQAEARQKLNEAHALERRIMRAEASAHDLSRHNGFARAVETAFLKPPRA